MPESHDKSAQPATAAPRRRFMRTAVAFYGLLMAVPLWWQAASEGPGLFYPEGFSVADTVGGFVTGALAGLGVVGLSALTTQYTRWGRALADAFAALLGRLSGREVWALALLSGFGEEMFFRGFLQPRLGLV
ncbi:MAG: hypothetical protein Q8R92_07425, partial [Deltaproteobacteria bacterium]|nr:hypothetical protein [Deltaproteobacteria bacterium]